MRRPVISLGLLVAVIAGLAILSKLNQPPAPSSAAGCSQTGQTLTLKINEQGFDPTQIRANRCDSLNIINTGQQAHQFALGSHPKHIDYPGFEELIMQPGQQNRLVLSVSGNYLMHDHLHDQLKGNLEIANGP